MRELAYDSIIQEMVDDWRLFYPYRWPDVAGGAPTTWLVRKTGADTNGGTSASVLATNTDGVTNVGNNHLTSVSAPFTAGMVGHGIQISGNWRLVTVFNSTSSIDYSGAAIATGTGRTFTVGGSLLTIGKAANTGSIVASGDSVYFGAGSYAEANISASMANVAWIADVDGVKTGDGGDVVWTAYLTNNTSAPSTNTIFSLNSNSTHTFTGITFIGGTGNPGCINTGATAVTGFACTKCTFIGTGSTPNITVSVSAAGAGPTMDRCVLVGSVGSANIMTVTFVRNSSADYDCGAKFVNSLWVKFASGGAFLQYTSSGAGANFGGGGIFQFNTILCGGNGLDVSNISLSGLNPLIVAGNYFLSGAGTTVIGSLRNSLIEDWNIFDSPSNIRSNVNIGPNSIGLHTYAPLWEVLQSFAANRDPRPWMSPAAGSPASGYVPNGLVIKAGQPATAADDNSVGTIAWTNPNNALTPDGANFATNVLTASATGHYLKITNLGFALPSDATVTQIRVEYQAAQTGSGTGVGNSIRLVKGGVISGNDYVAQITNLTASQTLYTIGSAADLWGLSWLYSDINASTFGVVLSFKNTSGASSVTPQVDYVRITVNYTRSAGNQPSEQTIDFTSRPRPSGGGSNLLAAGCHERHNTDVRDTSTVNLSTTSRRFTGPGTSQDYWFLVESGQSYTLTAYMRYDGTYTGAKPSMSVVNGSAVGVADATASMVGSANQWEQLSLAINPTSDGVVYVRFRSNDTNGGGQCWYADFAPG